MGHRNQLSEKDGMVGGGGRRIPESRSSVLHSVVKNACKKRKNCLEMQYMFI